MNVDYLPAFKSEGTLEEIPLPVLLAHILDEKLAGVLHIEAQGLKHWIYFTEGFPSGVHVAKSQDYLGPVLRELGMIDDATYNESLMLMAQTKRLQGQILLEKGKVTEEQLDRALSLQVARKLSRLFSFRTGSFHFQEDEELPTTGEPIRVNPYALIYNGIKNHYTTEDLKKGLGVLMGKSCKVSRLYVERKDLFDFPPDDLRDAELLRDFRLPQDFVRNNKSGTIAAMMLLLTLLYCGMLELEEVDFAVPLASRPGVQTQQASSTARPVVHDSRPSTAQSPKHTAERSGMGAKMSSEKISAELLKKINEKFEQVKTSDVYKVLEVEKNANDEVIKKSFLILAKVYHPDRIGGVDDEDLRHRMDFIFSRLNEAYAVLSDPQQRMEYETKKGTLEGQVRPEDAKTQFGKALVFLKKKDYLQAAELVKWAIDLDPKNGDYKAYSIWIEYLRTENQPENARLLKAKGDLLAVYKNFKESFFAVRFLSAVFNKLGDQENYEKCLKVAHRLNPKDIEISRELRLVESRKEKDKGSFLGIKFKK